MDRDRVNTAELAAIKRRARNLSLAHGLTPDEAEDVTDLAVDLYRACGYKGVNPAGCDAVVDFAGVALDLIRAKANAADDPPCPFCGHTTADHDNPNHCAGTTGLPGPDLLPCGCDTSPETIRWAAAKTRREDPTTTVPGVFGSWPDTDLCPRCPKCGAPPLRISFTQAFCTANECRVLMGNPTHTAAANLTSLANTPPVDLPVDLTKTEPGLKPANRTETPCPAPTETPDCSPPA